MFLHYEKLCLRGHFVCFTDYYSIVYPDWPILARNRHLSLFLIVSSPILILSVLITILVKHKFLM